MRFAVGVLFALVGITATSAAAQSMRKCYSADGSVWYTHQSCPMPNPHDDHVRKCVSPNGQVSFQQEPCAKGWRLA
jgi:hypothetical protein